MIRPQFTLDLHNELIVDNFAGGGGASTGIELALGRCVDIAINHDPEAIALHTANHPQTRHYIEDVFAIDPASVTQGRPVGLAWFSPDCKHFSKAKGGAPRSKKIRGLAWVAVKWAAAVAPRVIILENVEEFQQWGPLLDDGSPCPARKGETFQEFVGQLVRLGYAVDWRELRACDYGAPTIRKRLFLIARCDGRPIVWPEPTHADPAKETRLLPWRTAADCVDWSVPCPSIFQRARPLADATCRRIARGIMRYVINSASPFIVNCANSKTTGRAPNVWPLDEPARTITTSPGFAVVAPFVQHIQHSSAAHGTMPLNEPMRTVTAAPKGGGMALVAAFLAKHYTGVVGAPLTSPMPTVTTVDHNALVAASMVKMRGDNIGSAVDDPLHTISAGGTHHALVRAFLVKYYGNEREGETLREPLHTVTTKDRFGLVTVEGQDYAITDIGMRMLTPRELYRAQGFPDSYNIDAGYNGKPLTKTAQVRMCGNSVCPPLAQAIVRANAPEMAAWFRDDKHIA